MAGFKAVTTEDSKMTASNLIDGKAQAAILREQIAKDVQNLNSQGIQPGLSVILVGEDPASQVYVGNKIKACESTGITSFEHKLPADTTEQAIIDLIKNLNNDPSVHGILLQLPLPGDLDADNILPHIAPEKDVDGLHPMNVGKLVAELDGAMAPCTPQGSLHLIHSVQQDLTGLHAVVIGRSLLFGKPMAQLLLQANCTVTTCHSRTKNIEDICKQADILVAAVGRPKMVKADWVKDGAIIIDVGINRQENGKLCGDVDFDAVAPKAKAITPVPGGVGPMTIACLLQNTVKATRIQNR